jgi:hypothetical protein
MWTSQKKTKQKSHILDFLHESSIEMIFFDCPQMHLRQVPSGQFPQKTKPALASSIVNVQVSQRCIITAVWFLIKD